MNLFKQQPEFINTDARQNRPIEFGYTVTAEFMQQRFELLLPKSLVENKSVLDVGSCVGSTGAWCLTQGAKEYTGIEIQNEFVELSRANLTKYYQNWLIIKSDMDAYCEAMPQYDIVCLMGILGASRDPIRLLSNIANHATVIVVDGSNPTNPDYSDEYIENGKFIAYGRQHMNWHTGDKNAVFEGFRPSVGFIRSYIAQFGFQEEHAVYQQGRTLFPEVYNNTNKFLLRFTKHLTKEPKLGFSDNYENITHWKSWQLGNLTKT